MDVSHVRAGVLGSADVLVTGLPPGGCCCDRCSWCSPSVVGDASALSPVFLAAKKPSMAVPNTSALTTEPVGRSHTTTSPPLGTGFLSTDDDDGGGGGGGGGDSGDVQCFSGLLPDDGSINSDTFGRSSAKVTTTGDFCTTYSPLVVRRCSAHPASAPRCPPAIETTVAVRVDIFLNQFLVLLPAAAAAMAAAAPMLATSTLLDRAAQSTSRRRSPPLTSLATAVGRLSVVLLLPCCRGPRSLVDCIALVAVDFNEFIIDSRSVFVHTIPDDWVAAVVAGCSIEFGGSSDARRRAGMGGAIFSHTSMLEYLLASLNLEKYEEKF